MPTRYLGANVYCAPCAPDGLPRKLVHAAGVTDLYAGPRIISLQPRGATGRWPTPELHRLDPHWSTLTHRGVTPGKADPEHADTPRAEAKRGGEFLRSLGWLDGNRLRWGASP